MYQSLSRMRNAVEGGSGEQPRLTHRLAHPLLPNILIITPDSPLISAFPLLHTVRVGGLLLMLVSVAACVGSGGRCTLCRSDRGSNAAFTLMQIQRYE